MIFSHMEMRQSKEDMDASFSFVAIIIVLLLCHVSLRQYNVVDAENYLNCSKIDGNDPLQNDSCRTGTVLVPMNQQLFLTLRFFAIINSQTDDSLEFEFTDQDIQWRGGSYIETLDLLSPM